MIKLIGAIVLLFMVTGTGPSAHADGSWCVFYDASTYNCGFSSWEQCYETARGGGGGFCRPNYFKNDGAARLAKRRARNSIKVPRPALTCLLGRRPLGQFPPSVG